MLIVSLDREVDFVPAVLQICREAKITAAEVRARGALVWLEVCDYQQHSRRFGAPRRYQGNVELLSLHGTLSLQAGEPTLEAQVALIWANVESSTEPGARVPHGPAVAGGRLVAGRVLACALILQTYVDVTLIRSHDPATGLHRWGPPSQLPAPPATPTPATPTPPTPAPPLQTDEGAPKRSWSQAIAASAALSPPSSKADDGNEGDAEPGRLVAPRPGDWLDHPTFGRCPIERVQGDADFVSVRLRNQRLVRLSLEVLRLEPVEPASLEPQDPSEPKGFHVVVFDDV
jgi:predicted DNA-binding protein with PD1-like motif